jgi:acetoin utilization deacetylase AcuC-like enzyme
MLTVHSPQHILRNARTELYGGELVTPFECPARVDTILDRIVEVSLGEVVPPSDFSLEKVLRVHDPAFIEFLEGCWAEWQAEGFRGEAIPTVCPTRGMQARIPKHIEGRLGYYAMAMETSISDGTWEAARSSANVALTAQQQMKDGSNTVFALCRPPGHHAASDLFGGYCFINNAAVCAQAFRSDVMFLSLHGDPRDAFPHFLGYADETGAGQGEGFNHNYPMGPGTPYAAWSEALADACKKIAAYAPDALVVSLGVDTFERDPISFFKLKSEDFSDYGGTIAGLRLPTLFVMEGGYAVEEIGINTVNVLTGFEDR